MIFSKIENPKKSSTKAARASGVVNYITAPENENALEKCIYHEAVNFISDDLKSQTAEMISLSQEAVKSKDPIEHFVISWKSNERPTPEQATEAAAILIKQCGLVGHQYIIGLHDDTDNMHLHVVVNRVHPETFKVVKINKGFDKEAGHQAIAIIEKIQGWNVEANARYRTNDKAGLIIDPDTKRPQIFESAEKLQQPTAKAQAMEIQTGEKSAQRVGIENAAPIIAAATSWKDLHAKMAEAGMQYQRKGSGAIVQVGDELVKASDIDRKASLTALQKRFGPYQPPQEITPNEYHHHTKEPHPIAFGKKAGNGMRNLSECNLAILTNQGQTRRAGVLHIDARPGGRPANGLRRDAGRAAGDTRNDGGGTARVQSGQTNGREKSSGGTELFHQRLNSQQTGWEQYKQIKAENDKAKNAERLKLQKRHGEERVALSEKLKAERLVILSGDWRDKGLDRNALQSVLATQQAAEKLELQERQRFERKTLQAKYKPLPMYKQWKEQPLIVAPVNTLYIEPTVSQTLRKLKSTVDSQKHITYQLAEKNVFRDEGRIIQILDLNSDEGIAAALALAQQKFGNVLTLTGSTEFQQNAVAVAVANNLTCRFSDPTLDKLREQLQQQKYKAERDAARAERPAAAQLENVPQVAPLPSPIQQIREAVRPTPALSPIQQMDPGPQTPQPEVPEQIEAATAAEELPPVDHLDNIYRQLEISKETASKYSPLQNPAVLATEEGHGKHIDSQILASNDKFIAVIVGKQVQILKLEILNQNIEYEGHAEGVNRFAVGNDVSITPQRDGSIKTVISEKRQDMQTEATHKRERDRGHGL